MNAGSVYRWLWLGLALVALLVAAITFRYEYAEGGYVLDRWTGRVERRLVERKRKRVPIREDRPNWPVPEEDPILDYIHRYRPADTMRQR